MAKKKPAKPKPAPKLDNHAEAVRWFRSRVAIGKDDWLELDRKARERAFTVARVSKLSLIDRVLKALTKAIEKGETVEQFRKRVGPALEREWGEERAWHVNVIFRNNVQAAYAHGREAQLRTPEMLEARPFWMFSAILDDRTTDICRPLNGAILPADHPWWQTHTPPLHHNCRSIKRPLSEREAAQRGVLRKAPKADKPQEGFGGADPLEWEPDLEGFSSVLVKQHRRR